MHDLLVCYEQRGPYGVLFACHSGRIKLVPTAFGQNSLRSEFIVAVHGSGSSENWPLSTDYADFTDYADESPLAKRGKAGYA